MDARSSSAANGSELRSPWPGAGPRRRGRGALPTSAVLASAASASPRPKRRMMGTLSARRGLEWLLGLYFLSHIPITLLFDLQAVLPRELYPVEVRAPGGPGRGPPNAGPSLRALRWCPAFPRLLSSALGPAQGFPSVSLAFLPALRPELTFPLGISLGFFVPPRPSPPAAGAALCSRKNSCSRPVS